MARPLRIELPGGVYHVTSRGDRREAIYFQEADRLAWLALLGEVCRRFHWVCHAYCQMTNHYHVVLETPEANLSQGMRQLNGVYTQYVNRTYSRVGHVFQGRYRAIVVEKDAYLLELSRYVVLNPVRAALVDHPAAWPWSSYRATAGEQSSPEWLQTGWLLGQFSPDRPRAVRAYAQYVQSGIGLPSIWEGLRRQIFLGSDEFVSKMQNQAEIRGDLAEVSWAQRRPPAQSLEHYAAIAENRQAAMVMAYQTGEYSLKAIADYFGVHYATVSRTIKRYQRT